MNKLNQWIVGVDLGGTTTKLAFITLDGDIVYKWEIPTDNSNSKSPKGFQ